MEVCLQKSKTALKVVSFLQLSDAPMSVLRNSLSKYCTCKTNFRDYCKVVFF